jgi:hypothetical protein
MICRGVIHAMREPIPTTPDITRSKDNGNLDLQITYSRHLGSNLFCHMRTDAKAFRAGQ